MKSFFLELRRHRTSLNKVRISSLATWVLGGQGHCPISKELKRQSLMGQVHPETKHRWNQPRKRVLTVQALLVQPRWAAGVYLFPSKLRDELHRLRAVLLISLTAFTQHDRVRPSLPPFLPYLHILYSFVIYLTLKFFLMCF